jgi:hypothetical protein
MQVGRTGPLRSAALLVTTLLAFRAVGEEPPAGATGASPAPSAATMALATSTPRGTSPDRAAAGSADAREPRYPGTYVFTGGDTERAAVKVAVDRATEGMFGKVIAREELMKRSEVRPSYTIRLDGAGTVSVETPGFPSESSPIDGTEVPFRTKYGDAVKNSQQFVDGALVQRGRTDDGSGSTEFRLQPDGDTLVVTRVSRSPRLPRPVEFTLTYRRQQSER